MFRIRYRIGSGTSPFIVKLFYVDTLKECKVLIVSMFNRALNVTNCRLGYCFQRFSLVWSGDIEVGSVLIRKLIKKEAKNVVLIEGKSGIEQAVGNKS